MSFEWTIPVPEGFRFEPNYDYLSRSANECMHRLADPERAVVKAIPVDGGARKGVLTEIRAAPEGGGLRLRLPQLQGEADPELRRAVEAYVREWFDLDHDLRPFYAMADRDPLLAQAARSFRGLHIVGIPDLFEAMSWGILGQQINLAFAYTLKRRFVEAFGERFEPERTAVEGPQDSSQAGTAGSAIAAAGLAPPEDGAHWLFPSPERVAGLAPSELTRLQLTGKKAEYLIGTAALIAEGRLSKAQLREAGSREEAEARLVAIRGIGPWTANYVLMRCLRVPSALPIADVGLHNAIKALAGLDRKPTPAEIRELAKPWRGWEAYATFYLWRALY